MESLADFKSSLNNKEASAHLSIYSLALWYAGKNEWEKAHNLIQDLDDLSAARIHAYLHRVEGDLSNARYWYAKANSAFPVMDTKQEWDYLVNIFVLNQGNTDSQ